ncbi:hypothetical protein GCM10008018_30760 [Paenibacillus marchantiophytorum]|uniref:Uncharacterized protein n=1 Tax=Paenibacillus marchantiophytorum TaxID=1619310 RepID=A0ABQ1ERL5_9BACL|nr:hypothetical protein [Paenibacillus marchantiophytorum]GFZ82752.1 hypothetical protein GCM10008018_30760 [Paenibacillus marchantiophytorum]
MLLYGVIFPTLLLFLTWMKQIQGKTKGRSTIVIWFVFFIIVALGINIAVMVQKQKAQEKLGYL